MSRIAAGSASQGVKQRFYVSFSNSEFSFDRYLIDYTRSLNSLLQRHEQTAEGEFMPLVSGPDDLNDCRRLFRRIRALTEPIRFRQIATESARVFQEEGTLSPEQQRLTPSLFPMNGSGYHFLIQRRRHDEPQ